jgi:tetratricopeptide (TPR) repeat protein
MPGISMQPSPRSAHDSVAPGGTRSAETQPVRRVERRADHGATAQPHAPAAASSLAAQIFVEAVDRHQGQQTAEAESLYRAILILDPRHAEASYNLGILLQTRGNFADAVIAYRHAIALRPDFAGAYSNLGTALQEVGCLDEAIEVYRQAIGLQPDFAMAHLNIGVALKEQGNFEAAVLAYRRALAIRPDYDLAHANLAAVLLEMNESALAVEACRQAVAINPGMTVGYCNLGAAFKALNRLDEAENAYRQAIATNPDFPEGHFCLAQILLLQGRYPAGWAEYEWRWKLKEYSWLENLHGVFAQPVWAGERLAGKTILVYAEQGFGDTIQFARYLPLLRRQGATVVLAVQPPLTELLRVLDAITIIPLDQKPLPHFDVHCALLNLPARCGTTLDTIPAEIPYLAADPIEMRSWRARIGGSGLRVGLVWAGNPSQRGDRMRSPRLAAMAPLFEVPDVQFVGLQLGPGRRDLIAHPPPPNFLDLGPEITNFADTAAIMAGLDLVISSCTAPLHLAGALGVPVWGVVPYAPHFVWQLDRVDSPWYPSLRLYRQEQAGRDWKATIDRVAADLDALANRRRSAMLRGPLTVAA